MDRKIIIKGLIASQHNELNFKNLLPREQQIPIDSEKIIVITGVRRCGKTTLLKLTQKKILEKGVLLKNTLFFSFDDERLMLKTEELDLILQAYRELYPDISLSESFFFFDEIQNIDNWEKFIRRVYDSVCKNIFISGSNSKQLGSEIATSLRGRTIQYELFPLSFTEYLSFKNIKTEYYSDKNRAFVINAFYVFLKEGGFPETVNKDTEIQFRILNDYYQVLLFRDIVERYKVTKIAALKYYIQKLLSNLGKPFSVNKIFNELKSQGLRIDKDALYEILEYIEAVYLGHRLYKFDYSVVNRQMSDKKIYVIDNGLLNAISYQFSDNYGKLLENAVFIWLKRKFPNNIYYQFKKTECDFVVFDKDKPKICIQVSFDISNTETKNREVRGLVNALEYFKLNKGMIITVEQEEEITIDDKNIKIIPSYKLMIDNNI